MKSQVYVDFILVMFCLFIIYSYIRYSLRIKRLRTQYINIYNKIYEFIVDMYKTTYITYIYADDYDKIIDYVVNEFKFMDNEDDRDDLNMVVGDMIFGVMGLALNNRREQKNGY